MVRALWTLATSGVVSSLWVTVLMIETHSSSVKDVIEERLGS
jgi:hypothetical protein